MLPNKESLYTKINVNDDVSEDSLSDDTASEVPKLWRHRFFLLLGFCFVILSLVAIVIANWILRRSYPTLMESVTVPYSMWL